MALFSRNFIALASIFVLMLSACDDPEDEAKLQELDNSESVWADELDDESEEDGDSEHPPQGPTDVCHEPQDPSAAGATSDCYTDILEKGDGTWIQSRYCGGKLVSQHSCSVAGCTPLPLPK